MALIKTKGIILSENKMGDYDKMVTMLTPGYGKIGCVAKGARKPKSLLMASTQFLCFGEYLLYKGAETYHINSAETIEIFYPIRTDLDKLKYASHITKIILEVTTENENSYKVLQLFLNTLYMIAETNQDLDFLISVFKLRLICLLGFTPTIHECIQCHKKENISYFSLKQNGVLCNSCGKLDTSCIQISATTVDAIRYIVMAPPKKIFSFEVPKEAQRELSLVTKLYLNAKLEKEYPLEELF